MQGKFQVIEKKAIAKGMFDMTVLCKDAAEISKPGQFVHILAEGFSLRRPVSICEINKEKGTLRIVFEVRGKGTEEISRINTGELIDMIAPLGGRGFTLLEPDKKAICVGGGIGTPPMLELAKHYGENATVISGFRTASLVILQKDFFDTGANTILCTDDGSTGIKGVVTDPLKECISNEKPDIIYSCGPKGMLRAVCQIADENGISTQVSLEERMGCGVGACLVCACKTMRNGEEHMAHVCQDGPVFDSKEVIW
ncbi:MAG: dihydroorotate dehydrogenase electron transfer subunit [Oscillospiraceae bacterium]|jgi:dihydroorotate dehydrogenase electron transfer subunit